MSFSIPNLPVDQAAITRRIVVEAAHQADVFDYKGWLVLNHTFAGICSALCTGHTVRFPCFGAFFPYARPKRGDSKIIYVQPFFLPSRGFKAEVNDNCSPGMAKNDDYRNYMKNHNISKADGATTTKGLANQRVKVLKNAFSEGHDVDAR